MENRMEITRIGQNKAVGDLQWLASKAREIKFGTILGLEISDGVVCKGVKCRVERKGKPLSRDKPEKLADAKVLNKAINDLAEDASKLRGICKLRVTIANGTIITWDIEERENHIAYRSN
jgi:hypothetical protein